VAARLVGGPPESKIAVGRGIGFEHRREVLARIAGIDADATRELLRVNRRGNRQRGQ